MSLEKRMEVWSQKAFAKKNNLYMEEWLTGYREKLFVRCRQLKKEGVIKEVFTDKGDIKIILEAADGQTEQKSIWSDKDLEPFEKKEPDKGWKQTFYFDFFT